MRLVDSHSHFDVDAFDVDRAETLARARDAGVVAQVVPAIDAAGWPRLKSVCASAPGLHAAYGPVSYTHLAARAPSSRDAAR